MTHTAAVLADITSEIVTAYLARNHVQPAEMPELIASVHAAFDGLGKPSAAAQPSQRPAVPIKKSVTADFIVSLEDGRRFKTLKRHLTTLGTTPDAYRAKWGLPKTYPMVAPAYAAKRSELSRAAAFGSGR